MRNLRNVMVEAVLVAAVGLVFALGANALSPRGLRLTRNYFPDAGAHQAADKPAPAVPTVADGQKPAVQPGNPPNPLQATLERLRQHGLQTAESNGVVEMFGNPGYEQGLLVLVDARDDSHYREGHIPGAWQFDHYHPEQYLPTILPVCLNAQKVVVYCNGGACEDSEFAAIMLRDAGIPAASLYVYAGGISEWKAGGRLVETGARRSGQLVKPNSQ